MSVGKFTLNGKVNQVGKDSGDVGIDQDTTVLTGWTGTLTSNYPKGVPLPDGDDIDYIDVRTITLLPDGSITEDGVNAGISLTAHDSAVFATPLQWTIQPGTVTLVSGKTFRPKKWTFNAPLDGVSVTLGGLTPVVGIPLLPAPGATPWDSITGKPAVATAGDITTAINNLKGTAGAALDTLGELSDALADDANYAATVTTALAGKAPLASPAFTGTPTGITKTHVGLGNADNTSDANKPVSTAQAAADSTVLVTATGRAVAFSIALG